MTFSALDSAIVGPLFASDDMRAVFADRARLQAMLRRHGLPVALLYATPNIRYATGTDVMGVWTSGTFARYCIVSADSATKAKAEIDVNMGSMSMKFSGPVEIIEQDAGSRRAVIKANAKEAGGQSNADGTVTITIGGDGGTVEGTANVSGKAASMGEGTIQAVLEALVKEFSGNISKA